MKKIIFVLSLLTYALGHGQQPVPFTEQRSTIDTSFTSPDRSGGCGSEIPNFTSFSFLSGPASQDFETEFDPFDCQAAADFTLTADGTLCQADIAGQILAGSPGFPADPDSTIILQIWDDAGGIPGEMIYSETFDGPSADPDNTGSFSLIPSGGPILTANTTYWLSIIAQLNFTEAGQWYWDVSGETAGNTWYWKNPQNGFGDGCIDWAEGLSCVNIVGSDLAMDLSFQSAVLSIEDTPFDTFTFYPNPVQDILTMSAQTEIQKMTLFNLVGQEVFEQEVTTRSSQVDLSELPPGVYFMEVAIADQKGTYRILKK